ncbi:MAG: uroporphyrinogen decarboxylase [Chloroflexi bacterium]|nr:uroporphyrinogen decarboxylase [Chloroflexota bacterium]
MTNAWNSRRRVLTALAHQEPDRLPLDFMGTASCMVDSAYFSLLKRLGLKGTGREFRKYENTRFYDERVLKALGVDFRRVWLRPSADRPSVPDADGGITDEWGLRRRPTGDLLSYVSSPLESATAGDLKAYPWPNPHATGRLEGLAEEARRLREEGEYAIVARSPTLGMFELAQRLRGMQRFLMDLVLDKEFAIALVQTLKEVHMGLYEAYLDAVGPYVDIVETSDDFGAQNAPLISPALFREIFAPARKELNDLIHRKAPQARVFLHSDGAIVKLIPDFIRIGVEILNPIEPDVPGNDPKTLKSAFGSEIVFHGHLDNKRALSGSSVDARQEVRRIFDGMGPGGGYIMAPTNHIQADVSPDALIEVYRNAQQYGRYGTGGS